MRLQASAKRCNMPLYNVEIRVTRTYQIESIRAKDEDSAIAKAFKEYEKNPEAFFDDAMDEAEADEIEA